MASETFTSPGRHYWKVPQGIDRIEVTIKGAGSGGRAGGKVHGFIAVKPGVELQVSVGEQGKFHSNRQPGEFTYGQGGNGGHGRGTGNGGDSGGGASFVSLNRNEVPLGFPSSPPPPGNGMIYGLAGGAGGNSGDGADGGQGGAFNGEDGIKGPGTTGGAVATGGDQLSGGKGGKNPNAPATFDGGDAEGMIYGRGGAGGTVGSGNSHGGGGGGGGWNSGGGGNASGGSRPAGSGGGGSNYSGGLTSSSNTRGQGNTGNGEVVLEWSSAAAAEHIPPPPPSDLKVNGLDMDSDVATRALTQVTFTATLANPDSRERTQMVVRLVAADNDTSTQEWNFANYVQLFSEWVGNVADGRDAIPVTVVATGLVPNQKYYVRAYALDDTGAWSQGEGTDPSQGGWSGGSFWTNRPPDPPALLTPSENTAFLSTDNIFFSWTPVDPDDDDAQTVWQIRTRRLARPDETVRTDWVLSAEAGNQATSWTTLASAFEGNKFYLWSARTRDIAMVWSDWSSPLSFFVEAVSTPPIPLSPQHDEAVVANATTVFKWQFLDPSPTGAQLRADLQWRVVGTAEWITFYGEPGPAVPGSAQEWAFPLETFIEGYHYEWQVRTTNLTLSTSEWSTIESFWATKQPGQGLVSPYVDPALEVHQPALGCGVNRVFIFDRGGEVVRGEITGMSVLRYERRRDDISSCRMTVDAFDKGVGELLGSLRTWMHEIVVFRDGKRVWEGPITRLTYAPGEVSIEAKDVMAYLYRRIMRQGYNDTYRKVNGVEYRGTSVVHRAKLIAMNALAYDDPNVLQWLTEITHSGDAKQMRAVPDFSKTAWEEIDDLAATAGLDYTTVTRRILLWDTHRAIGRLPEMRDEHFSQPVHVTEYGMSLANFFVVTNNDGVYGAAWRGVNPGAGDTIFTSSDVESLNVFNHEGAPVPPYYGWIEQLVSAYGEKEGEQQQELTDKAKTELEETLRKQAQRGIAARWPAPLVVRVPDNSTVQPDVNIGFDQLIPGVWIPVRARGTLREVSQWQKLDVVTVEQNGGGAEQIMVTMSPAPNGGQDPDADSLALEG